MDDLVLEGRLDTVLQCGDPFRGRGRLVISDLGVRWEIRRAFFGARYSQGSWNEIHRSRQILAAHPLVVVCG
jgi:hypothetical protein